MMPAHHALHSVCPLAFLPSVCLFASTSTAMLVFAPSATSLLLEHRRLTFRKSKYCSVQPSAGVAIGDR